MAHIIFDLDGTVIDSRHRQLTDADGNLDLAHWREHCTTEKIMQDTLLPLADVMKRYYAEGHCIIICTARVFTSADFAYLQKHSLHYHHIITRGETDMRGDAEYKRGRLNDLAQALGFPSLAHMGAIMFDDNLSVIAEMMRNRVICHDATSYNRQLKRGKRMPLGKRLGLAA